MNKKPKNNKLSEGKQADANPNHAKTQEKEYNAQEQEQLAPAPTESIESGHAEPTKAPASQDAETKTSIKDRLRQLTNSAWHSPVESKSVAVNSLMVVLTFILALFAYGQWQVSKDSVAVAQKSLEVANATLKDARDSAKEASDRAERITKANESLAEAARRQAEASAQISKTSGLTAMAAGRSASISQQALIAGNRAFVSVDKMRLLKPFEADQPGRLVFEFVNDGNNPAEISGFNAGYFVSKLTSCENMKDVPFDTLVIAPKSPRTQTLNIIPISQELLSDMKSCDDNGNCKKYFQVCINANYTTLGGRYVLKNCSYYYPVLDTFMQCKKQ